MSIIRIEPSFFEQTSCDYINKRLRSLLDTKVRISVALPGGSTPMPILQSLAQANLDWSRIDFYQTDERLVPIEEKANNYRSLSNTFFSQINSNSFPMYTGKKSPEKSCADYTKELEKIGLYNNTPRFDLIILGMGEDGHIASLFPNSSLLNEQNKWVALDTKKRNGSFRMTLCFSVLLNALETIILVKGNNKLRLIEDKRARKNLPVDKLFRENKNLTVLCSKVK